MRDIVLNLEPRGYSSEAVRIWTTAGLEYSFVDFPSGLEHVDTKRVRILIVRFRHFIDRNVLGHFPRLRAVVTATTGVSHIDCRALEERDIALHSLRPHADFLKTIPSTAEHAWALILGTLRNITQCDRMVRDGVWDRDAVRGDQIAGKSLGVVGLGRTGSIVANIGLAFGMSVRYFDPFVRGPEGYQRMSNLEALVASSDIVTLHVHLTEETEGLISRRIIANAKNNSVFVNTSRAGLWDERAIVDALRDGRIQAVATDVLRSEMSDLEHDLLWQAQREGLPILITPHVGGATVQAMEMCEEFMARYVSRWITA